VGGGRNTGMSDQAKSAVGMSIRSQAVCVNDVNCRKEADQKQTDNSENPVSEKLQARLGSELGHLFRTWEWENKAEIPLL
jgi:hypothetical protein